jgi:hypothetical protein
MGVKEVARRFTHRPGEPSDLVELGERGHEGDSDSGDERPPDGASCVAGQGVDADRSTEDTSAGTKGVGDEVQRADELTEPSAPDVVCHVGDGVASRVGVSELSERGGRVGVDGSPADEADRTANSAEGDHGGRDGEDTGGEDHLEEDDGRAGPAHGTVVDTALDVFEHLCKGPGSVRHDSTRMTRRWREAGLEPTEILVARMGLLAPATGSALRLDLGLDVGGDACLGVLLVLGHDADHRQVDKSGLYYQR